jgi:hypothetical protein
LKLTPEWFDRESTLRDNEESGLIGNAMQTEEFIGFIGEIVPQNPQLASWWNKLCAIAGVVSSATCWCVAGGWCLVACVPAAGIGLTCFVLTMADVEV